MDLITFWDSIVFTPKHKDKGYWVMSAVVDSGMPIQLHVVTENKASKLCDMKWKFIYGIEPTDTTAVQYFTAPFNLQPILSVISEERGKVVYGHKWEPYTITKKMNPNVIDMNVHEDNIRLVDIILQPGFTIKHL